VLQDALNLTHIPSMRRFWVLAVYDIMRVFSLYICLCATKIFFHEVCEINRAYRLIRGQPQETGSFPVEQDIRGSRQKWGGGRRHFIQKKLHRAGIR
jgi:hypothetical protein